MLKIGSNSGVNGAVTIVMYSGIMKLTGLFLGYIADTPDLFSTSLHGLITTGIYLTNDELAMYDQYLCNLWHSFDSCLNSI